MARRHILSISLVAITAIAVAAAACAPAAAPTPTAPPKQAPAATKAPEPTKPAAPAATKAPEATKPAAAPAAAAPPKPAGWPNRSITLIIPWNAGGSTDVGFRLLAPKMEKVVGGTIEIVNRPGAGAQVGVTELARAKPDGYTVGNVSAPAVITHYLDPRRQAVFTWDSFAPIGLHVFDPGVMAVKTDSKYKTLKDLVDDAKANPEKVKAGTTGILGDDHLAILLLEKAAGIKFATVHFEGGAPQQTALLGGHIDVGFDNVGSYAKLVKDGRARVLAVMDEQRNEFLPGVPTVKEAIGVDLVSSSSRGLAAPKGTPKDIVWYMSYAMEQAIKDPEISKKMADQGLTQRYMNPDQFDKYWRDFEVSIKPLVARVLEEETKK